jgi:hypothetical protein
MAADDADPLTLSDDWRDWVVENLLRGAPRTQLVDELVAENVPEALARTEVDAIATSPLLATCARLSRRLERRELYLRLRRETGRPRTLEIERRPDCDGDELFARYYETGTPVVLTDAIRSWPACTRWSPEDFRARLGDVEVEAMIGRNADPHCDRDLVSYRTRLKMAELVDRVRAAGVSNDIYLIAHNQNLLRPELHCLLDDVAPDPKVFDPALLKNAVSLWFGPAGTLTPLHHDGTNILFCQIYGRKRVVLVAPEESSLLDEADGFYARHDPESGDWPSERVCRSVELQPGEALFIPAGWWHQLRALDVSISFSLMNFRRPNNFDWYRPGAA